MILCKDCKFYESGAGTCSKIYQQAPTVAQVFPETPATPNYFSWGLTPPMWYLCSGITNAPAQNSPTFSSGPFRPPSPEFGCILAEAKETPYFNC